MRRSMCANPRYPPLLCWLAPASWIAAAPVAGPAVEDVVAGGWAVLVGACELCGALELAPGADAAVVSVEEVVAVAGAAVVEVLWDVVTAEVPVALAVLGLVVVLELVVLGLVVVVAGGGVPAGGGSVEVPGPVTSAPLAGAIATKAAASGAWMLASAPPTLPPRLPGR